MPVLWYPDFCPNGGQCVIEEDSNGNKLALRAVCPHHGAMRSSMSDAQIMAVIVASTQAKERARWVVKQHFMSLGTMDKEHPGVPYRVEPNGDFTILSGAKGGTLATLRTLVSTEVSVFDAMPGVSKVTVA